MSFIDRVVEYPGRVTLTPVTGQTNVYDMTRNEGTEYIPGTLLNANNLNQQTQLDNAVETLYTSAGMVVGTYQNEVSDALGYLYEVVNTYGRLESMSSTLSLTTTAKKLPLNTFTGNNCQLSSNGIKVNKAGLYMIWGSAYFSTGFTALDLVNVMVYVNSSQISDGSNRIDTANYYNVIATSPVIMPLAANDVVYLYARNGAANRGVVENRTGTGLYLKRIK